MSVGNSIGYYYMCDIEKLGVNIFAFQQVKCVCFNCEDIQGLLKINNNAAHYCRSLHKVLMKFSTSYF